MRSLSLLTIIGLLSWLGFAQLRTPSVIPGNVAGSVVFGGAGNGSSNAIANRAGPLASGT